MDIYIWPIHSIKENDFLNLTTIACGRRDKLKLKISIV